MDLNFKSNGMTKCQDVKSDNRYSIRYNVGNNIVDPIIGEPIFPGSITIVSGESGTGKTTFLLQMCGEYAKKWKTGYVSGEQNEAFLKVICERCNVKDVDIGNIVDMDEIISLMSTYKILVVDSFPCIKCNMEKYGKMSKTKMEEFILLQLAQHAQKNKCALYIILHSTKAGQYKGSTFFIHTVDNMILLKRVDGKVSISLEKSRSAPPNEIILQMNNGGFDYQPKVAIESTYEVSDIEYKRNMLIVYQYISKFGDNVCILRPGEYPNIPYLNEIVNRLKIYYKERKQSYSISIDVLTPLNRVLCHWNYVHNDKTGQFEYTPPKQNPPIQQKTSLWEKTKNIFNYIVN